MLLLSDAGTSHTKNWAFALASSGMEVGIFSLLKSGSDIYEGSGIHMFEDAGISKSTVGGNRLGKLSYLSAVSNLKKAISIFKPDVVHAHYASSYGLLGSLSGFHPFILSVWGSDVYEFPESGFLAKQLLKYNLRKADVICSTSHVMARQTKKYSDKPIEVVAFGIDTGIFKPQSVQSIFEKDSIVVGTVKKLSEKYGTRYLIEAFKIVHDKFPDLPLRLLLVGDGAQREELESLVKNLGLDSVTKFTGNVSHRDVPLYHNMIDIPVYVSVFDSESFGVSVIESGACGKAVVVSSVGGLTEVVKENSTGLVVPPRDATKTASAIEYLLTHPAERNQMGEAARKHVQENYEMKNCTAAMLRIYQRFNSAGK